MKGNLVRLLSIVSALFLLLWVDQSTADTLNREADKTFSISDEKAIRLAVARVRKAILDGNADELLQNISLTEGLVCTDTLYSYNDTKTFLHNKQSHLYLSVFDSAGFSLLCGKEYSLKHLASDKEFLSAANQSITISRVEDDWAEVTITSSVPDSYPLEWSLHRESGTWRLAGRTFIIGTCQCG